MDEIDLNSAVNTMGLSGDGLLSWMKISYASIWNAQLQLRMFTHYESYFRRFILKSAESLFGVLLTIDM